MSGFAAKWVSLKLRENVLGFQSLLNFGIMNKGLRTGIWSRGAGVLWFIFQKRAWHHHDWLPWFKSKMRKQRPLTRGSQRWEDWLCFFCGQPHLPLPRDALCCTVISSWASLRMGLSDGSEKTKMIFEESNDKGDQKRAQTWIWYRSSVDYFIC